VVLITEEEKLAMFFSSRLLFNVKQKLQPSCTAFCSSSSAILYKFPSPSFYEIPEKKKTPRGIVKNFTSGDFLYCQLK
jgi:hypothetical protein